MINPGGGFRSNEFATEPPPPTINRVTINIDVHVTINIYVRLIKVINLVV
jgi:hypothetical protein